MSIKMSMSHDGRLYRYEGGKFIAVWEKNDRHDIPEYSGPVRDGYPVPDDIIMLPMAAAKVTTDDLRQLVREHAERLSPFVRGMIKAQDLFAELLATEQTVTHAEGSSGSLSPITGANITIMDDGSKLITVSVANSSAPPRSLLPNQRITVARAKKED